MKSHHLIVCLLVSLIVTDVQAGIVLPGSTVEGQTIAQWTGHWWNWVVQEPLATNPLLDADGSFANLNQNADVFFLAGNLGDSTPTVRSFNVPTNKYLLLPLVNYVFWAPEDGADETALRALANSNVDDVDNLTFQLDGVELANPFDYREQSLAGGFTLGFAPLLADVGLSNMDRLAVSDGYWVMIEPLSAGSHQIIFGARQPGGTLGTFDTQFTLNLNAVPEPASLTLVLASGLVLGIGRARYRRVTRITQTAKAH